MTTTMPVYSPLTGKPARLVDQIPVPLVIDAYQKVINLNVTAYFAGVGQLSLYQCEQTGYRFYDPAPMGDSDFYKHIGANLGGYYPDWKWENQFVPPHLHPDSAVLDIGCGNGGFLQTVQQQYGCQVTGLEFNQDALAVCRQKGLTVYDQTIEDFAQANGTVYDAVCAFQVVEHIPEPRPFLEAALHTLKPGGKLFIAVPNNEPYLFEHGKYQPLNMPPHHCGLWNTESLTNLATVIGVSVVTIQTEKAKSLTDFLIYPYLHTRYQIEKAIYEGDTSPWLRLANNMPMKIALSLFNFSPKRHNGHTIVAVYQKP